ncbi:MAG: hypothetical protein HQL23_08945 [Candidatus Omnitrophica bacterium]|nr:hypothetical protein [Candidatus Omnitrophota bacterium]
MFFILLGFTVAGLAAVLWLLKNEPGLDAQIEAEGGPVPIDLLAEKTVLTDKALPGERFTKQIPERPAPAETKSDFQKIALQLEGIRKPEPGIAGREVLPLNVGIPTAKYVQPQTLSSSEQASIAKEVEMMSELAELREKYERLDQIFAERSRELETTKEALENEVRNRKDFNKVKDLLEKELHDSKDKNRMIHVKCVAAETEAEGYKKRIAQLEEKVARLEKNILEKEQEAEGAAAQPPSDADSVVGEAQVLLAKSDEGLGTLKLRPDPTAENSPTVS